jgi:UPF0716 protein FxsA
VAPVVRSSMHREDLRCITMYPGSGNPSRGWSFLSALAPIFMAPRLGCFALLLPFIELFLLVQVGHWLGMPYTLGWIGLSAALGFVILRTQGVQTLARFQAALLSGGSPGRALVDGVALWMAGAFLLMPGPVTDLMGVVLLLPLTRHLLLGWALARLMRGVRSGAVRVSMMGMDPGTPRHGTGMPSRDDPDEPPPRPGEIIQP